MRNALQCFARKENALHDVAILACKAYVLMGMRVRAGKNALQCFAKKENALHDVAILACKAYGQVSIQVRAGENALQFGTFSEWRFSGQRRWIVRGAVCVRPCNAIH